MFELVLFGIISITSFLALILVVLSVDTKEMLAKDFIRATTNWWLIVNGISLVILFMILLTIRYFE